MQILHKICTQGFDIESVCELAKVIYYIDCPEVADCVQELQKNELFHDKIFLE